jgi:cyclopropane fatty-acyl-phospholipid synthase-like methyltransferase
MGATQFRLLTTLGLRETDHLLDFGCGSLRAGRLFLPYLLPGHYYGVEPNQWLLEHAIANEIGQDMIRIKRPSFLHTTDFRVDGFAQQFDFILAQSIFSHCGIDLIATALANFKAALAEHGLVLATFIQTETAAMQEFKGEGWIYPHCVAYNAETILRTARNAGLHAIRIPWFHPRQHWYCLAHSWKLLPPYAKFSHLTGAVLRDPAFSASS